MPKDVAGVLHEYKHGELHSGSSDGPVVTDKRQAIAIALSEQRQLDKKKRAHTAAHALTTAMAKKKHKGDR